MATQRHEHGIEDEGSLHKCRTEIPNTVVRGTKSRGISVYAKWLYVYLKCVAGDGGVCYRSTTTIAEESGISRGQVSSAKQELVRQGLITITPGKNPRRHADHIMIKNIWVANLNEFSVHHTNTNNTQCSQYEHQCSQYEQGVRIVNEIRSPKEDPLKKKIPPVSRQGDETGGVTPL